MAKRQSTVKKVESKLEKVETPGMDIQPIKKVEKKEVPSEARWFLVDFSISFKNKEGGTGIIQDTVAVGKLYEYPSKAQFAQQVPQAFGLTAESGFTDITVYGIRPWSLKEKDYLAYIKV